MASVARRSTISLFYSSTDVDWAQRLLRHLRVLGAARDFEVWDADSIAPGADRRTEIAYAALSAEVVVVLVSVDWLDTLRGDDLEILLRVRRRDGRALVPIITRPCAWRTVEWLHASSTLPKVEPTLAAVPTSRAEETLAEMAGALAALVDSVRPGRPGEADKAAPVSAARPAPDELRWPRDPFERRRSAGSWSDVRVLLGSTLFLGGAVGVAIGALASGAWRTPDAVQGDRSAASPEAAATWSPTLRRFDFEALTLDERGEVVARRALVGHSFEQRLGEGLALEMVAIPGGTFVMGSPPDERARDSDEGPQRVVTVAPFYLARHEVNQLEWRAVAGLPAVTWELPRNPSFFKGGRRPVERISWDEANEFCARLRAHTRRPYRLPSEAEWEYAARAGSGTAFALGETLTERHANLNASVPYGAAPAGRYRQQTLPVGSLAAGANAFGLFDVHGNVWEWVADPWHESYADAPADARAWLTGGNEGLRGLRGGAWRSETGDGRAARRGYARPTERYKFVGLRLACDAPR